MSGAKHGTSTQILKEEERALYTHCYGHALNLAVGDSIRKSSIMSDALDNCQEISDLLKYSPKRDTLFRKIKAEIAPESIGFCILCPTRWTVRVNCLQSIYENYEVLRTLWDECLQTVKQPDIKARINGVKTQMEKFNFFFGIQLGERILKHTDNLSRTLQNGAYSAAKAQIIAELSKSKKIRMITIKMSF